MACKTAFMQEITDIFWTKKKVNSPTTTREEQQFLYLKTDVQRATPALPSPCLPLESIAALYTFLL